MAVDQGDAGRFRPVRPVDEGDLTSVEAHTEVALPGDVSVAITGRLGRFKPAVEGEAMRDAILVGALSWERTTPGTLRRLVARLDGGIAVGEVLLALIHI